MRNRERSTLSLLVRDSSSPSLIPPLYTCTRRLCRTSSPLTFSPYEGPSGSALQRYLQLSHTTSVSGQSIRLLVPPQIAMSRDPDESDHSTVLGQPPQDIKYASRTMTSSSSIQRSHQGLAIRGYQSAAPSFSPLQALHIAVASAVYKLHSAPAGPDQLCTKASPLYTAMPVPPSSTPPRA